MSSESSPILQAHDHQSDWRECVKRIQATRYDQIRDLDDDDLVEGYMDGAGGDPEPGDNRSYAYWHGWTKGALDGGHREKTSADAALAHDIVANHPAWRLK